MADKSMLMDESSSSLVETIYSHVGSVSGLEHILSSLTQLTGSFSGCLISAHAKYPSSNVEVFSKIDPDWIQAYNDYYYQYDPTPKVLQSNPGKVMLDHVSGQRPKDAPEPNKLFYNELMRPQDFRHTLVMGLSTEKQWNTGIILQRHTSQGNYSTAEIRKIESLAGHLRHALQLHTRLIQVDGLQTGMAAAITHSPLAVILLDQRGKFVYANPLAEQLLSSEYPVDIKNGTLAANNEHDNIQLSKLLNRTIYARNHRQSIHGGGVMKIGNVLQVHAYPITELDPVLFTIKSSPAVAVWLSPCSQSPALTPELLREKYALTSAEAEILHLLVKGKSLSEISMIRSVKYETIRSQIKTIKSKFNISRQTELVRHILSNAHDS